MLYQQQKKSYIIMAKDSKIEWCDHTANLWWGCTVVHAGCNNCYAQTFSNRLGQNVWGNNNQRKRVELAFQSLDTFQRAAKKKGINAKVFLGSMMDIFEKSKPLSIYTVLQKKTDEPKNLNSYKNTGELRGELFEKISSGRYDNLTFLFLTKRPSNINRQIPGDWKKNPPKNVWFGTSPVDMVTFNKLVPQLKQVNGNRFLSIEPQLEEIKNIDLTGIGWVIQGGESGHGKRPFNLKWADILRKDCESQNVPYFFKQIDKVQEIPKPYLIRQFPW
jgi:protein gp37